MSPQIIAPFVGLTAAASLTVAAAVFADEVCTQGNLTRTVSIVYAEPGQPVPCEVLYDKSQEGNTDENGGSETLWRAQNEAGYCEARMKDFVAKLETLGWTCETKPVQPDD
jgi:hypothetical protein